MMKAGCILAGAVMAAVMTGHAAADELAQGKKLFEELQCGGCHDPVKDQIKEGMGPAQRTIAATYAGKKDELVAFLENKKPPEVAPENFMVMELQLFTLLADKSKEELNALATYLIAQQAPEEQQETSTVASPE